MSGRGYSVLISPAAWRAIMKLSEAMQRRVFTAIEALENEPRPSGVVKLEGESNTYRLRSGDYRIIYEIEDAALRVLVVKVGDRKEVYKPR